MPGCHAPILCLLLFPSPSFSLFSPVLSRALSPSLSSVLQQEEEKEDPPLPFILVAGSPYCASSPSSDKVRPKTRSPPPVISIDLGALQSLSQL
ncbi:hypothetical protein PVAP13_3NG227289 [Panicum virgatum]|uniref:Secreted protein n=1 Tax=Panicum virgatum TaxID=38727 RepID=A0A8T0UKF7_PANVG|nr:hypothetical protein PVAP13_3NG227289 [Panicum virgatum]